MLSLFRDSFIMLHFRWMLIRSKTSRALLIISILALIGVLVAVSRASSLIKLVASTTNPDLEAAKIFAQSYLLSFKIGELGGLVSATLAFAILSVVLAPFTGTSMTSLLPNHQLVSLTRSARHRFSDSVLAQFFSSISILQLLMLTLVASLLTIDEGRIPGVAFAWISWTSLVLLSCFSVWVSEYVARKFTVKKTVFALLAGAAVLGLALYIDPNHGTTVFGLGAVYADTIRSFSGFNAGQALLAFFIIALINIIFLYITYWMCALALSEPERVSQKVKVKQFASRNSSKFRRVEIARVILTQVWRNMEIRKPLLMVTLFGAGALAIFGDKYSLLSGMILIIPLISALSWGSNVFGMMGSGWVWLSSNPFIREHIIWVCLWIQVITSFILFTFMTIPYVLLGKAEPQEFSASVLGLLIVSFVMARSSLHKSVHRPNPYRAGRRGESALSPATILEYSVRFTGWAGMLGIASVALGTSFFGVYPQLLMAVIVMSWIIVRTHFLQRKFRNSPALQTSIVKSVGSDNN